jgi:hypothetical protein
VSLLTSPTRRAANRGRNRSDALRLLADGGCPICRRAIESQRQWIRAWINETNVDPDVIAAVRAARGFCASHLRVLLARTDAGFMLPNTLSDMVDVRLQDLAAGGGPAAGHSCPICQSGQRAVADTVLIIATVSDEGEVQKALAEQAAICLPHTVALLRATPRPAILRSFAERFAGVSGSAALTPITGDDPHADARARLIPALFDDDDAAPEVARLPAVEQAIAAVGDDSCGCCRVRGVAPIRYLRWLIEARQDLDRKLDPIETALCAAHLHDLSTVDPLTASWIADLEHPVITTRITRLAAALPTPTARHRAGAEALRGYDGTIRPCPACRAADTATESRLALLTAALPDAAFRSALAAGHGLCATHAPALTARSGDRLPSEVLRGRLQLLGWELAEIRRKREWWTRHERQGREMGAWRHAPTLLTGDTYLGLGPDAFRRTS